MESDGMRVNFESDADTCKAPVIKGDSDIKDAPASVDVLEEDYATQNKPKRTKHHHEMGSDGMGVNFESDANTCKDHGIKGKNRATILSAFSSKSSLVVPPILFRSSTYHSSDSNFVNKQRCFFPSSYTGQDIQKRMDMTRQIMFHRPIITTDMGHMEMPILRLRVDGEKKVEPNSLMRTREPLLVGGEKERDKMESDGMAVKFGSDVDTCNYHGIIGKNEATISSVYSSKSSAIIPSATFGSSPPSSSDSMHLHSDEHILESAYLVQDPQERLDMLKKIFPKKQWEIVYGQLQRPSQLLCGALKADGEKRGEPNSSMINRARAPLLVGREKEGNKILEGIRTNEMHN